METTIAHIGDEQTGQSVRQAVAASSGTMHLLPTAERDRAELLVLAVQDTSGLTPAAEARRRMPEAQLVLLVPDAQLDRVRSVLPVVPHMASAWTVARSAKPEVLAGVLESAAQAASQRRNAQALRDKINLRLQATAVVPGTEASQLRQRQLELSEHYLATVLAQAPHAVVALTPQGEIVAWNAAAERLFGREATGVLGLPAKEACPEPVARELLEVTEQSLADTAIAAREARLELPDGPRWVEISAAPVREGGRILSVSITLQDVSARHAAAAALRGSEARFRTLVETLPQLVWTASPDGNASFLSRQWMEYTGATEADQLGLGWLDAVHPDDRERTAARWTEAVRGMRAYDVEYRIRGDEGEYRWFKVRATPIRDVDDAVVEWFGTATDIQDIVAARETLLRDAHKLEALVASETQRRIDAEQALYRAQKMEAIGNLTGGIAHDFNNILQVVGGNLQLLADRVAGDERAARRVRNALAGVERGSRLASQLLAFGRRQPLAPKVVDIGRMVREMGDMLHRALGGGIEIHTALAEGLWRTQVDPSQTENALLNLALNARDAMEGQGRLTIEASNTVLDRAYARAHAEVTPGEYVMLAVSDTGIGMAPDIVEKVFEPFFTTKPEGKGTGLGLSMVYGFVKQSHGHIEIVSQPGAGTTFRIYLPRSTAPLDDAPIAPDGVLRGGTETVLVVEDDPAVLETVVTTIEGLGYRVLKARDAGAALAILESGVPIDLLFTDVVMPGTLKSPELARLARERLPRLAVLFTSGYAQSAIVHGGRLDEGVELLSKPYSRETLARRFRHALDKAAAGGVG